MREVRVQIVPIPEYLDFVTWRADGAERENQKPAYGPSETPTWIAAEQARPQRGEGEHSMIRIPADISHDAVGAFRLDAELA